MIKLLSVGRSIARSHNPPLERGMAAIRAFLFISVILPQTGPVYAAFYFNKSVEFIDVDTSQPITPNEITVQFNSVCQSPETECTVGKGQNYSFGLSSTHITPDNATTGSDIPPILIQDNWLNSDLKEVTYKEKSLVIPRQGQSWAGQNRLILTKAPIGRLPPFDWISISNWWIKIVAAYI